MSATIASTPAADGYRMPGEFEPHSGCWMAWPERPDNWRLDAKPAQLAFAAVAEAINATEPVTMAVSDAEFEQCRAALSAFWNLRRVSVAACGLRCSSSGQGGHCRPDAGAHRCGSSTANTAHHGHGRSVDVCSHVPLWNVAL